MLCPECRFDVRPLTNEQNPFLEARALSIHLDRDHGVKRGVEDLMEIRETLNALRATLPVVEVLTVDLEKALRPIPTPSLDGSHSVPIPTPLISLTDNIWTLRGPWHPPPTTGQPPAWHVPATATVPPAGQFDVRTNTAGKPRDAWTLSVSVVAH